MSRSQLMVSLALLIASSSCERFRVTREWEYANFTWTSRQEHDDAVSAGSYIKENNVIAGLRYFEDHYYVTLPRMKSGVPVTLARIPAGSTKDTSPLLSPYPSWAFNKIGDCDALQNVQNIEIDAEGKMWIIDNGITDTLSSRPEIRCPPKLIVFDMKKNATAISYTFPNTVASNTSNYLYDIVVDNTGSGYAYITDNSARDPGIIVFSLKKQQSWKIRHSRTMRADPTATAFRVNDVVISSPINIASIALGPRIYTNNDRVVINEDREVFYSPMSSLHMYSLNASVLKSGTDGLNMEYEGEVRDHGLKASQSVGMGMDNRGFLYYSLLTTNSIAKWNTHESFLSGQKIVAKDPIYLEWPNSYTFDNAGNLIVLVNRLNRFIYGKRDVNQTNFWLVMSNVGGKGYLYDESVEYKSEDASFDIKNSTEKPLEPEVLPGSPQDAFLVPQPMPRHKESTTVSSTTTTEAIPPTETTTMDLDQTETIMQEHTSELNRDNAKSNTTMSVLKEKSKQTVDNKADMNHVNETDTLELKDPNVNQSGSNRLAIGFFSFLAAVALFVL